LAKDKKAKLPQFTTPCGTFKWPKLSEPDYGTKDYPAPDGKYEVKVILRADDPATKKFIAALTPAYQDALSQGKEAFDGLKAETRRKLKAITENALFTECLDEQTEEPTGEIEFKAGMKASGEYKKGPKAGKRWERKPVIVDAKGNRLVIVPQIWGGTKGRVCVEASPYFIPGTGACGLKLNLVGVQIIELVSSGGRSAESMGFGEEDGYEHEEPLKDVLTPEAGSDAAKAADDDGSGDF